jgi:thiol-disulfide isomerase/thioredoxin
MRSIRRCRWLGLLVLLLPLAQVPAPAQDADKVEARVVKYDQLADTVRQLHGKVVMVDFWGIDCVPCKKAFPHVIEMQKKYGKDGFAVVSVAVVMDEDAPVDQDRARTMKFLQEQHATVTNLLLDEKPATWMAKLRFDSLPCVYVFNREGKWYQFKGEFQYADVEKQVIELLKGK